MVMPAPPAPASLPPAPPAPKERVEPQKVAVLPIEEDTLFRAERADLRQTLAARLAGLGSQSGEFAILPLVEVDAKLRPVTKTTGARCAYEYEPAQRRAQNQGWRTTDLLHVSGVHGQSEELWVQILGYQRIEIATWVAPWDSKLNLIDRYRSAFNLLTLQPGAGLLGGLGMSGSERGGVREGPIHVCEQKNFGECDPISSVWGDKARDLAACLAGEDDYVTHMLLQGDGPAPRCEMANLDAIDGRDGPRESCLCRALLSSAGVGAKPGRRTVRVHFEAPDLAGKPRPELRVIEASTNLHSEGDYHSIRSERDGKTSYTSLRRLIVDNLDALGHPLARCAPREGGSAVVDLDARDDGGISAARVVLGLSKKTEAACVERALQRGAFTCTDDGKPAKIRLAITWPGNAK